MTDTGLSAQRLRAHIRALMHEHRWNESETARRLRMIRKVWNQPRFHRCMSGEQGFSIDDLDDIAKLFVITVPQLFLDEYEQWDRRRAGHDRRSGEERRKGAQAIWTPLERRHWPAMFPEKKKKA